jgi:hypothetical protein
MEVEMDQRSSEAAYLGVQWMPYFGQMRRCYVWSDGVILPAIFGGDGEGDEGDEGEEGDEEGEDEDEDEDDEDEDDPDSIKNPKLRKASKEAARYRRQRNESREKLKKAEESSKDKDTKIKDLEKQIADGAGDEDLKKRVGELEEELKGTNEELEKERASNRSTKVGRQVAAACEELRVKEDPEIVEVLLQRNDMLEVDDDGEVDDLERNIKRLIKKGKLTELSEDDEEEDDERRETSGSRSGRSFKPKKTKKGNLDKAALEAKFPALRR